ncbi:hypothetical protein [Caldalkalibacillus salinus]|uniref:hypothetical protein n=1 Tax=Caldalkalibacillus salinus TaxID=2803787 RepID=UPI001921ADC3|nr:hypothetical protein [Caldalkalibacillus salinus]
MKGDYRYVFLVSLLILVVLSACQPTEHETSGDQLVGKWEAIDDQHPHSVEFKEDGTVIVIENQQEFKAHYSFVNEDQIEVFTEPEEISDGTLIDIRFEEGFLHITDNGNETRYARLRINQ